MSFYQRLLQQVAETTRATLGNMVMPGVVSQVKGDKMRVMIGKDANGQPVLSPWLNTANHRGGARERRFYKGAGSGGSGEGGQNVMLLCPGGDPSQAVVLPYGPNKNHRPPDHANQSGQDEETYQLDDLRVKKTKDGYDFWLQPAQQTGGGGGGQQSTLPQQQGDASGQALMKVRMNRTGGITARIGNEMRFSVHQEGVKMKAGKKKFAVVTKKKLIMSEPWEVGEDPVPDDDA